MTATKTTVNSLEDFQLYPGEIDHLLGKNNIDIDLECFDMDPSQFPPETCKTSTQPSDEPVMLESVFPSDIVKLQKEIVRLNENHKIEIESTKIKRLSSKNRKRVLNCGASKISRLKNKLQKAKVTKTLVEALKRLEQIDPEWKPPHSIKIEKK